MLLSLPGGEQRGWRRRRRWRGCPNGTAETLHQSRNGQSTHGAQPIQGEVHGVAGQLQRYTTRNFSIK